MGVPMGALRVSPHFPFGYSVLVFASDSVRISGLGRTRVFGAKVMQMKLTCISAPMAADIREHRTGSLGPY